MCQSLRVVGGVPTARRSTWVRRIIFGGVAHEVISDLVAAAVCGGAGCQVQVDGRGAVRQFLRQFHSVVAIGRRIEAIDRDG